MNNNLTVKKIDAENINAALHLINDAYTGVRGFKPLHEQSEWAKRFFTKNDLNTHQKACFFVGLINGRLISLAYGAMGEAGRGLIHRACVHEDLRGACYSIFPMQKCIIHLKDKGAKQIHVDNWMDAPYRKMVTHFESKGIQVKHGSLVMRIDMRQYTRNAPSIKEGYEVRTFREGDDETWANLKNAIFDGSTVPSDFWTQSFLGVSMDSDFDPQGFFFAEKEQKPVGICAGVVMHKREKIGGAFPGGIGWTGVLEEHRGKGVGKALLISSLNYLYDKGVVITEVETQFYRTAAVNMYESLGFRTHIASFDLFLKECNQK